MAMSNYSKDTDRTTDVLTHNQMPFSNLVGEHAKILQGLTDCGFINASPIQVAAIPLIRDGNDTIVEAKNGTGKTLTFVIPTLMKLKVDQSYLQVIILAPTREIAVQIQQCFKKVGQHLPNLRCEYFIGGTPVETDKQKAVGCQIAVGSPGRIKHLLNEHVLKGSEVKKFILDEVDRLFTDKNFTKDVRMINAKLPNLKQMIVASASIDKNDMSLFDEFMKEYTIVKGSEEDMNDASQDPSKFLLGIKQYVACVKAVSTNIILLPAKNVRLLNILQNLPYTQCIVFTNYMTRVEAVCNMLRDHKYKADYIRGDQDQDIRLKLVDRLTSFKSKILVATDLIARGIDSSNVDLVINMDCPNDSATYLHRIGRAGRFGNKGNAFTILDDDKELKSFKRIINNIENVKIKVLPIAIEKLIDEYTDNELEDLNLTIESNDEIKNENEKEDCQVNSAFKHFKPKSEIKCVYGPGITPEESLERLRQVVIENERILIENNLVNKRYLTPDRSFILFDPVPYLDDSERYRKYSPKELLDIIKNYDSDFDRYDAVKMSEAEQLAIEDNSTNELSSNEINDKSNQSQNICDTNADQQELQCQDKCEEKPSMLDANSSNDQVCLKNEQSNQSQNNKCDIKADHQELQSQDECKEQSLILDENSKDLNNLNELNSTKETVIIDSSTNQRPQFSNIYDLFNIPTISSLKSAHCNDALECSVNEDHSSKDHLTDKDENVSTMFEKDDVQGHYVEEEISEEEEEWENIEEYEDEEENEDEEEYDYEEEDEEEEEEEEEEEDEDEEEDDDSEEEEEEEEVEKNYSSCNNNIESEHFDTNNTNIYDGNLRYSSKSNDKGIKSKSVRAKKYIATKKTVNVIENNENQFVDCDILNDWYKQWKQQLHFIQTCVRMSK